MIKAKKSLFFGLIVIVIIGIVAGVIMLKPKNETKKIESLDDLKGQKVVVLTGAIFDKAAEKNIEDVQIYYGDTEANDAIMLDQNKVAAWVCDEPLIRYAQKTYPNIKILQKVEENEYAFVFNKDSTKAQNLCAQLNEYLAKIKEDGTLKEIDGIWFGTDEEAQKVDIPKTGENGTLTLGVSTSIGAPFTFVKDEKYVGYDIDVAARFCKEYGYGLSIKDYDFTGMLSAVQGNKDVDFGVSCITITEERKEKILFSDADYLGGIAVAVNDKAADSNKKTFGAFIDEQKDNFTRTFIRENRWKLFAEGVKNTMLITVLSILIGTVLGFCVFWLSRETGKIFNFFVTLFMKIVKGMPLVVLLMVLYYIIFANSSLSNITIAIIGFSLVFGAAVCNMLTMSADTVSYAQTEASLALGFTKTQTFIKVILPQALRHFLPAFQAEVVTQIKATAIVGYLAIQDLTKMSDIVRGRTYEAFFPLIVTAIIYFVIEFLLVTIVRSIQFGTDPKRRSVEKILKGVKTK